MIKPPSKRGQCGKNAIPKLGLTPTEEKRIKHDLEENKKRWQYLLSLNKWQPTQ
jgi:hypothetical protein